MFLENDNILSALLTGGMGSSPEIVASVIRCLAQEVLTSRALLTEKQMRLSAQAQVISILEKQLDFVTAQLRSRELEDEMVEQIMGQIDGDDDDEDAKAERP